VVHTTKRKTLYCYDGKICTGRRVRYGGKLRPVCTEGRFDGVKDVETYRCPKLKGVEVVFKEDEDGKA
jgi:hypothetical protein